MENPGKILIVDDTPANISILGKTLETNGYEIATAPNGEIALEVLQGFEPDLILMDIMMPGMDGYETCKAIKKNPNHQKIPVIFISALNDTQDVCQAFSHGGVDYVVKPFRREEVLSRVETHLQLYHLLREREKQAVLLEEKVRERTQELNDIAQQLHETRREVINCLGRAGEYRDNETGMHVVRMSYFSARLGREMGMSEEDADLLFHASPMHDIGKIGIPDNVLLKPGKLDAEEWEIMKTHVTIGVEILSRDDSPLMAMARLVALHHHEKFDGSGYPNGLKGDQISLEGRIIAVCDVFDALTSERPYKKAWSMEESLNFLEEGKGKHFDPLVVDTFKKIFPEMIEIKMKFGDE